ncbi:GGDEF domain-containing protein [Abyssicoccus albus]|uniref:GGDEF domain-containing protein n=1 Tax=Abyssicoccus albus TaxID=1817405 RepID=UPI00097E2900|nr:GGDEF domain-containing protein [Abyssicoccus albus]AQL56711.1 hypothetical protein BVH56_07165 [Abyssicoccus albus]
MLSSVLINIAIIIAGVYLLIRIQLFDHLNIMKNKNIISILMTLLAIILLKFPIQLSDEHLYLSFLIIILLSTITSPVHTFISALVLCIAHYILIHFELSWMIFYLIIAIILSNIAPFIKANRFKNLMLFLTLALMIFTIFHIFNPVEPLVLFLFIPICYIAMLSLYLIYNDLDTFSELTLKQKFSQSKDILTSLYNVRQFDYDINEANNNIETIQSFGLILIDIDHFKSVNDNYGFDSGDLVLKQMSQLILNYLPRNSKAYRNSGEEFSIISFGASYNELIHIAESIRKNVEKSTFHTKHNTTLNLTVSIGIGYKTKDDISTNRKVFIDADEMLYEAKKNGTNKVMFNPTLTFKAGDSDDL